MFRRKPKNFRNRSCKLMKNDDVIYQVEEEDRRRKKKSWSVGVGAE